MTIRRLNRLGRRFFMTGAPIASVLLGWTSAGTLLAQTPAGYDAAPGHSAPSESMAQRNYLNKSNIKLPIQIDESARGSLKEVQLYVKEYPKAAWKLRETVPPAQQAFTVQLPRDGEYAFTMVTVDKQGRRIPEDLRHEPARLVVVIDTQAPVIELTKLQQTPEGQLIQFDVRDANLDNGRVRFLYQGGDRIFRPLDSVPGNPHVFCIPVQAVCTGLVRAIAEDLAGNITSQEEHLNKMTTREIVASNPVPTIPEPKAQPRDDLPKTLPRSVASSPDILPNERPYQRTIDDGAANPHGQVTENRSLPKGGPRLLNDMNSDPVSAPATEKAHEPGWTYNGAWAGVAPKGAVQRTEYQTNAAHAVKRQIVNNAKLFLDYQIENAGPNGIGKVEVWITRDLGKSWTKISEDANQKSPVEVQLPGEGLFGVTLVASSGRGAATPPPVAGDTPDWWIEVDTTKPAVEISKLHVALENGQAYVHLTWNTQDRNLGESPVDLFYGATPQGPWLPIAKGLKAEGKHRWAPPVEIGAQAYLRLTARDAAGNTTIVNTLEPVLFGEPVRPRAVIRGISTGAPIPTSPEPNLLPIPTPSGN